MCRKTVAEADDVQTENKRLEGLSMFRTGDVHFCKSVRPRSHLLTFAKSKMIDI